MSLFEGIIGYDNIKKEFELIIDVLNNKEKYQALGVKQPAGICLAGAPGIGKTSFANAFMDALTNREIYVLRKNDADGDFVKTIKQTFDLAKENEPSVVLLDDIDKFANNDSHHRDANEFVTVQSCIDECKTRDVYVIATANDLDDLPDSLLRAGRLKCIQLEMPKGDDARKIVEYYLKQKKFVSEVDALEISEMLSGSSCAELENVVNQAGIYAGFAGKDHIDEEDMIRACLKVIYDRPESNGYSSEVFSTRVGIHEAGHAVVAELLEPDTVTLISIGGQNDSGQAAGLTIFKQADDYWIDKDFMEHRVISLLAGKAATEIVTGKVDVGASSDIQRAQRVIARFIDDYSSYDFSDFYTNSSGPQLADRKDAKIGLELARYYQIAKKMLIDNREFLDKVYKELCEKKYLRRKDIVRIKESLK